MTGSDTFGKKAAPEAGFGQNCLQGFFDYSVNRFFKLIEVENS